MGNKNMRMRIPFAGMAVASAALILAAGGMAVGVHGVKAQDGASTAAPLSTGGPATIRRLSEDQYKAAIADIFGSDIKVPGRFEPRVREEGLLTIGDGKVNVTPSGFEQYTIRAREMPAQILDAKHRDKYLSCAPKAAGDFDEACARTFFTKYGRLLYRRPLARDELKAVMDLARASTATSKDFYEGVGNGLTALLASPNFIFRMDAGEPDPVHRGQMRLDSWSLASRISFLLWNSTPDEELLDAAASGKLRTDAGLAQQVDRLIASPRFEQGVRAFFTDMVGYDDFDTVSKDAMIFPIYSPRLRNDAKEQSLRTIVDLLIKQNGDYRDLFTTKHTFMSRQLGALYGVPITFESDTSWVPYTFKADDPRAGLLTMAGFLMLDPSHEGRSSPTIRGKRIRENYLCQRVPDPPANVNFNLVQDVNNPLHKTARDRLLIHQENPVCAGCHKIMDPIGLSLENYTAVGRFRTSENGAPIDASGTLDGKTYRNGLELGQLMHDSPSVPACVVQRTFEYGIGRPSTDSEKKWLDYMDAGFARDGYKFPALLRQIATSQAFQAISKDVGSGAKAR